MIYHKTSGFNFLQSKLSILSQAAVILIVTVFLPNIILYLIASYYHLGRPLIVVDYFISAILWFILPSFLLWSILFLFFIMLDIALNVLVIFFFNLDDIFIILNNINLNILAFYSKYVLLILLIAIVFLILIKIYIPIKRSLFGAIIITVILFFFNLVHFLFPLICSGDIVDFRILTSPVFKISRLIYSHVNMTDTNQKHFEEIQSATGELIKSMRRNDHFPDIKAKHLVLIIVESFGMFKTDCMNNVFMEPFQSDSIKQRYEVKIGCVPFSGNTTHAELRELCGIDMNYQDIKADAIPKSLPQYLASIGFKTLAFHGFHKTLFSRYKWYPLLGFGHSYFYKEIIKRYNCRHCGVVFRGIRDDDITLLIERKLMQVKKDDRLFLYWVTLNSHLPISEDAASDPGRIYSQRINEMPDETMRLFVKLIYRVMFGVSKMATNPNIPATHFILVGDHRPPFISPKYRDLFVNDRVPFIELIPKD